MEAARSRAHAKQTSHRHSNGRQARHINSGRLLRRHLAGFYTAVDIQQVFRTTSLPFSKKESELRGWPIGMFLKTVAIVVLVSTKNGYCAPKTII